MTSKTFSRPMEHSEYLLMKYGGGSDSSHKSKKKRKNCDVPPQIKEKKNLRIYDDDIDLSRIKSNIEEDDEKLDVYYGVAEDKPCVDKVIDDRPMSQKDNKKWKSIGPEENTATKPKEIEKNPDPDKRVDKKSKILDSKGQKKKGLATADELAVERKRIKEEEKRLFDSLGPEALGKNAKSIYRDKKTGRIRDLEKEKKDKKKLEEEVKMHQAKQEAKFKDMSKGLKQVEEAKVKMDEEMLIMKGTFSTFEDDNEFNKYCKSKELAEDPMLALIKKERAKSCPAEEDKKKKFLYNGTPAPPNRFDIHPGHRWDGVDRSNGYEKKYFQKIADRAATKEEAYRWATEDM
ncbi:uncharacterized protein LOC141852906 [Brevipalpus obovatus]|uniref:uncharacterized protein LOC141852906 n=1 Tax=Brevipalpus obovatus TaxID=246614 RepID=UPI003D9F704E